MDWLGWLGAPVDGHIFNCSLVRSSVLSCTVHFPRNTFLSVWFLSRGAVWLVCGQAGFTIDTSLLKPSMKTISWTSVFHFPKWKWQAMFSILGPCKFTRETFMSSWHYSAPSVLYWFLLREESTSFVNREFKKWLRQRQRHKTMGLMTKNNRAARAGSVLYISLPYSAKHLREVAKFKVFTTTWARNTESFILYLFFKTVRSNPVI